MIFSKRMFIFSLLVLGILLGFDINKAAPAAAQCPATDKVQQDLRKLFPNAPLEVTKVEPAEFPGLCAAQVKMGNQIRLVYTDPKGDYILAGNLFEVKTAKNLTLETTQALNKLTPEEMRQLEPLTAFTLGQGKKIVYFVTDPQCPYCKQVEPMLKKLSEKEGIQVRYLLFPLASHKGAREQCISILCDKKGLEGWEKGYKSDNQCPEGVKKVDETVAFLQKQGIQSTPTFILSDGVYLSGAVPEEVLRARLGLPKAAAPTAK
jgi:thiol:disulfide interchange protein DsbC